MTVAMVRADLVAAVMMVATDPAVAGGTLAGQMIGVMPVVVLVAAVIVRGMAVEMVVRAMAAVLVTAGVRMTGDLVVVTVAAGMLVGITAGAVANVPSAIVTVVAVLVVAVLVTAAVVTVAVALLAVPVERVAQVAKDAQQDVTGVNRSNLKALSSGSSLVNCRYFYSGPVIAVGVLPK